MSDSTPNKSSEVKNPSEVDDYVEPMSQVEPMSDAAIGAVVALVRVCELYDGAVAHRAALRAAVASRLLDKLSSGSLDAPVPRSTVIAAAALADVDVVISRPLDPEANTDAPAAMLGPALVGSVPGLRAVSEALENQHEHWDGSGSPHSRAGEAIPFTARVVAATRTFVGNPATGFLPSTQNALRRTDRLASRTLDPALCEALHSIDMEGIDISISPSDLIVGLLGAPRPMPTPAPTRTPSMPTHSSVPSPPAELASQLSTEPSTAIRSAVAAAGHTDELLSLFAESAVRTLQAAEVVVLRLTPTELEETPLARAVDGLDPALPGKRLDDLAEFSTQAELRAGTTLERPLGAEQTTELIVPIVLAGQTWGVLIASRRTSQPGFDAQDLSVLRHIATEAADAITSTTHWAEMERMALRDQLTGLANRHELYRVLDAIFERPPLERVDCALIMCDVDGLKVVNDTLGHQAGDRLLIDAAAALRGAVRHPERTTICRIGGDEFCVLIDGGALLTAHDVSDTIERLFARSAGSGPPRSISCGIAFANEEISTRSALLRAADENQYETKRARRASREALLETISAEAGPIVDRRAIRD